MGIAERLDYRLPDRNAFHGMVAAAFGTRPGGWFGYHVAPRLDRASQRLTNGRGTITEWFAGVPPIWLTTTGARTGEERLTPLFGIPFREDIALIGTGFGRARGHQAGSDCPDRAHRDHDAGDRRLGTHSGYHDESDA